MWSDFTLLKYFLVRLAAEKKRNSSHPVVMIWIRLMQTRLSVVIFKLLVKGKEKLVVKQVLAKTITETNSQMFVSVTYLSMYFEQDGIEKWADNLFSAAVVNRSVQMFMVPYYSTKCLQSFIFRVLYIFFCTLDLITSRKLQFTKIIVFKNRGNFPNKLLISWIYM